MALYMDQFSAAFDFPGAARTTKSLIIASTPRSGSHYLGHALHHTGFFGAPFEYANLKNLQEWQSRTEAKDLPSVMHALMARRTSATGVFSIKVHWSHVAAFGGFEKMLSFFPDPRVFQIRRRDMLGQAISTAIAQQTGVYISGQKGNGREPIYDFMQVYRCLRVLLEHNACWQEALATCPVAWDAMDFEDVRELDKAVRRVSDLMDIHQIEDGPRAVERTRRQSTPINEEWRSRFLADMESGKDSVWRQILELKRGGRISLKIARKLVPGGWGQGWSRI